MDTLYDLTLIGKSVDNRPWVPSRLQDVARGGQLGCWP